MERARHGCRIVVPGKRFCACMDVSSVEGVLTQSSLQGLKCQAGLDQFDAQLHRAGPVEMLSKFSSCPLRRDEEIQGVNQSDL